MTKQYNTLVLIGRFQPVTVAHREIIRRAVELTDDLIILVGSPNQPRTYKNPFSYTERRDMLNLVMNEMGIKKTRVHIEPITDYMYNDNQWATKVQGTVSKYRVLGGTIGIIGHKKDDSSFYFDLFPQWEKIDVGLIEPLNASSVRDLYFRKDANMKFIRSVVPTPVYNFLESTKDTPQFEQIIEEREFIEMYRKQFEHLKYPPIFVTSDACVICCGHVLLIKRRAVPGKGLWALPGGYVNANTDKSVRAAAIRELREETGLKIPEPVLIGSIKRHKVFDAIDRSPRGRIITHCYGIFLTDKDLPKVKGGDDAEKAVWVPIGEIKSELLFEDHWDLISTIVGF